MGLPFCAICDREDVEINPRVAGMQSATKDAADTQYNAKLTERRKYIAIKANNDSLLADLAASSLASNELFYHLDCYLSMSRNYQRMLEGKD